MVPMRYGLGHGLNAGATTLVGISASDGTVDVHHCKYTSSPPLLVIGHLP